MPIHRFVYRWRAQYAKDYVQIRHNLFKNLEAKLFIFRDGLYVKKLSDKEELYSIQSRILKQQPILAEIFTGNHCELEIQIDPASESVRCLILKRSKRKKWHHQILNMMLEICRPFAQNELTNYFENHGVKASFDYNKWRIHGDQLLRGLTCARNASAAERKKMSEYRPVIELVHPDDVTGRLDPVLLVDCTNPVHHLMDLIALADRIYMQ